MSKESVSNVLYKVTGIALNIALAACAAKTVITPTLSPDSTPQTPTPTEPMPAGSDTIVFTGTPSETPTETLTETPSLTPTETLTPIPTEHGPSREFSPLFPAEWSKEWTGKVTLADGSTLSIPVIVGLASDVVHNPDGPITGVFITPQGADAWTDAYVRACYDRYTNIMGYDVTYEQYLELLTQPTGGEISLGILNSDGKTMRMAMIDPRQGFSLLLTDKLKMPVADSQNYGIFLGVDGKGRLLTADNLAQDYPRRYPKQELNGVPMPGYKLLRGSLGAVLDFAVYTDKCLLDGVCSERTADPKGEHCLS
jgi:hypothetical protein